MPDQDELTTLRQRVAELEKQLAEEREEFEWDLKAARESAEATVQKLEAQLKQVQKSGGDGEDADMLARRAMKAERRVSELEYELKKLRREPRPRSSQDDSFLKQRAEEAERERDKLRKQVRELERQLNEQRQAGEKLSRQLAERERVIERLANDAEQGSRAGAEAERLQQRISELERQLGERDGRISELAQELNQLGTADGERERLAAECSQLQQQLEQDRQRIEQLEKLNEEHVEQLAETSKRAETAENELARLKLASGQMMEQREREAERLKSDLAEAERRDAQSAQRQGRLQQQLENTRLELERLRVERDQAVEELRRLRDRQTTQVAPPPQAETDQAAPDPHQEAAAATAGADPFEEHTVKTSHPAGALEEQAAPALETATVRDGTPLVARADDTPQDRADAAAVETGAVASEAATDAALDPDAGPEEHGAVALDDEDERIAEEWLGEADVDTAASEARQPAAEPEPAGPAAGSPLSERRTRTGTQVVRRDGDNDKEAVDTAPMAEADRQVPARRFPWVLVIVVVAAAGLIFGAWKLFPVWFGTVADGAESVADAGGQAQPQPVVDSSASPVADAGSGESSGSGQPVEEGAAPGESSPSATEPEQPETAGGDEPAGTADSRPAPPGPAQLKLYKSLDKALKRRRYAAVQKSAARALQRYPDDARLHYYYGRALFYRKQRSQALQELQRAVELDPGLVPAYYELIGVNKVMGRGPEACQAAAKYLELSGGRSRRARAVKRNLRKLGCR